MGLVTDGKLGGEVESASGTDAALRPYPPLHQLDHAPRNGQPEAGAAELACCRGIDLRIGGEDQLACILGNPDPGVADCEPQCTGASVLGVALDPDDHFALVSELDGVSDEVNKDLPEPRWIADERPGHVRGNSKRELEPFLMSADGHDFERLVEYLTNIEVQVLERQMARLYFGKIQDVVDQVEELTARFPEDPHVLALFRDQGRFPQQVRHADDRVHWRAYFMAHSREEIALGAVRILGGFLGFLRFLLSLLPLGSVFHCEQEQLAVDAGLGELAGIEEHRAATDGGKVVSDLEIPELGVLWNDVFQQASQLGNVPLAVAELVQQPALRLSFRGPERAEKRPVGHLHMEIPVENQQGLSHRLHDSFCKGPDFLQDRFSALIGSVASRSEHFV